MDATLRNRAFRATVLGLLSLLALELVRAGSTPAHRRGLSALYGRQLLSILRFQSHALLAPAAGDDDYNFETGAADTGRALELALAGTTGMMDSDDRVSVWNSDLLSIWGTLWPEAEGEEKGVYDWTGGSGEGAP
jgi:hypothetical protein